MLGFLADNKTLIDFEHRMSGGACANDMNMMTLNSRETSRFLVGAVAHEARHLWQYKETSQDIRLTESPDVAIARSRFMEADAHLFNQKFLEDYTRVTGNTRPLESFHRVYKNAPPAGLDDAARFKAWCAVIRDRPHYQQQELNFAKGNLRQLKAHGSTPNIAPDVQQIAAIARKLDSCWPYSGKEGSTARYLANVSDKDICEMARPADALQKQLSDMRADYQKNLSARQTPANVMGQNNSPSAMLRAPSPTK